MTSEESRAAVDGDVRDALVMAPQPMASRDVGQVGSGRSCAICNVLFNILLLIVSIILLPIIILVLFILCLLPMLEKLTHPRRQYLDGVGSSQINNIPEAIIHAIMISKERVSAEEVFTKFRETYLTDARPEFARFKQRIVRRAWFWPYWTDMSANFEPARHFLPFAEPVTKEELEQSISDIQLELFDLDHPVWELRHYENFIDENGKACSATMLRLHHAMCDGFTGMRILMQGADPNKPPVKPDEPQAAQGDRRPKPSCLQTACYFLVSLKKLLLMQNDKPSIFKSAVHIGPADKKHVAWTALRGKSVHDLKLLARALGGASINDVLLTALAGSLRTYNHIHGGSGIGDDVTSCMWVSLSPLKHIYTDFNEMPLRWGNGTLGAVYLKLPVGEKYHEYGVRDSLALLRQSTTDPSLMIEASVATSLLSLFGSIPRVACKLIWGPLANKVSVSMSNVPGPQFSFDWCRMPIRCMLFFVPPTGSISLFVTIATCNGEICVGMGVDAALMSQEALKQISGDLFEAEIGKLFNEMPNSMASDFT